MNCPDCTSGPKGIDGHEHLRVDERPHRRGLFSCAVCGETYTREYQGSGVFVWIRVPGTPDAKE
jgi:hypothetical protein